MGCCQVIVTISFILLVPFTCCESLYKRDVVEVKGRPKYQSDTVSKRDVISTCGFNSMDVLKIEPVS